MKSIHTTCILYIYLSTCNEPIDCNFFFLLRTYRTEKCSIILNETKQIDGNTLLLTLALAPFYPYFQWVTLAQRRPGRLEANPAGEKGPRGTPPPELLPVAYSGGALCLVHCAPAGVLALACALAPARARKRKRGRGRGRGREGEDLDGRTNRPVIRSQTKNKRAALSHRAFTPWPRGTVLVVTVVAPCCCRRSRLSHANPASPSDTDSRPLCNGSAF